MDVGLVAGVPENGIGRGFEDAVERQRQLDNTEVGPEMASCFGDGADNEVANLNSKVVEFGVGQVPQISGCPNSIEGHWGQDISPSG